jgi:transposase
MATPSLANVAIAKSIIAARRQGLSNREAALAGGVSKTTLQNWIKWGKHSDHTVYALFAQAYEAAYLAYIDEVTAVIARELFD